MIRWASGPVAVGSRVTPHALDSRVESRKPAVTSAWRDSAQKSNSSLRYSGASVRSRR